MSNHSNPRALDENNVTIIFTSSRQLPKIEIEVDDEATLYQSGQVMIVRITGIQGDSITGTVDRGTWFEDESKNYTDGEVIEFSRRNIFGISKGH